MQEYDKQENANDNIEKDMNLGQTNIDLIELEQEEAKPANKKMTILNFIIIIVICAGLLIYMITVDGVDNIINVLKTVDYRWVVARIILLIFTLVL